VETAEPGSSTSSVTVSMSTPLRGFLSTERWGGQSGRGGGGRERVSLFMGGGNYGGKDCLRLISDSILQMPEHEELRSLGGMKLQ
jgi:hypothetical protein